MIQVSKILSFDRAELRPYQTMRRQLEHREQGIFVAEGAKVVRRLLESQFGVVSVLLPEKWLQELQALLQERAEEIQVFVAEKKLLETLTGFSMYQGLLAVGRFQGNRLLASCCKPATSPICSRRLMAPQAAKTLALLCATAPRSVCKRSLPARPAPARF